MRTCYLTTFDNPYDPQKEFSDWYNFDCEMGYYSLSYLDRIAKITPSMSEPEEDLEYERAINEIIKYDFRNIYTKKYIDTPDMLPENDDSRTLDELIEEYYSSRTRGDQSKTHPSP